jgi:hypothetical protein
MRREWLPEWFERRVSTAHPAADSKGRPAIRVMDVARFRGTGRGFLHTWAIADLRPSVERLVRETAHLGLINSGDFLIFYSPESPRRYRVLALMRHGGPLADFGRNRDADPILGRLNLT